PNFSNTNAHPRPCTFPTITSINIVQQQSKNRKSKREKAAEPQSSVVTAQILQSKLLKRRDSFTRSGYKYPSGHSYPERKRTGKNCAGFE
ncbi:MAG: hypothetical protein LBE16_01655, partial [Clostridiales Family XIII bacterium]|nr:hypothetical protein [Clostridiales Family XIII bacterium]